MHRNRSNLRTKLGKIAINIISSKSNHKTYQIRHDSAQKFSGFWIHWYKMVTGIELMRYQTKYRPNEHQKLPSKKPLVAMYVSMLIRFLIEVANTLLTVEMNRFIKS